MKYKEIVTKAVIGKGKKVVKDSFQMTPSNVPNTVLGCWVINHNFSGSNNNGTVIVNGAYDVNVWYSYDYDSKTAVDVYRYNYQNKFNVKLKENTNLTNDSEIIVRSLKQPTVLDVSIENGNVLMNIEKELGIEIVGDTKIRVSIEETEEDYDILEDVASEEELDKIIETIDAEVKENYIE